VWLLILPMILLTVLIPFLLLAQDMKIEQNKIKTMHLAHLLKTYNNATIISLTKNPVSNGFGLAENVNSHLPPMIKSASFWGNNEDRPIRSSYYKNSGNCEVISFMRTTEGVISLQDASGSFSNYWAENGVTNAGIYRSDTKDFIDSQGTRFDLRKFNDELDEHRNGVPIMYSIQSC